MRRSLEGLALLMTFVVLVATSRANVCAVETLNVRAQTTCGAPANLSLSSTPACSVSAGGAAFGGIPTSGFISGPDDAGFSRGFVLSAFDADAGVTRTCTATPDGGAFDFSCSDCATSASGNAGACTPMCSGTLTPQ